MGTRVGIGDIFSETFRIAGHGWPAILIFVVVVTGLGVGSDLVAGEAMGAILDSLVSFSLAYVLMLNLWRREGLPGGNWSLGALIAYLVATCMGGVGMVAGIFLLVVPGLILMARWALVPAFIVGRGMTIGAAFGESWSLTRSAQWTLVAFNAICLGTMAVFVAMLGGGFAAAEIAAGDGADVLATGSAMGVIVEAAGNLVASLFYCSNVALYVLLVTPRHEEETIFA